MGMDVYGLRPKLVGEKPDAPNWSTATNEEKDVYFKASEAWEEENPGYYFRANIWAWRPIHILCDLAIKVTQLPLSTEGWENNSGEGLKNQDDCDALADALDLFLILNKNNMKEDDDRIYICMGMWVKSDGTFAPGNELQLNKDYPSGTIMYNGVVGQDGNLVFPAHSISVNHVKEFITFLRHCGGFEIC